MLNPKSHWRSDSWFHDAPSPAVQWTMIGLAVVALLVCVGHLFSRMRLPADLEPEVQQKLVSCPVTEPAWPADIKAHAGFDGDEAWVITLEIPGCDLRNVRVAVRAKSDRELFCDVTVDRSTTAAEAGWVHAEKSFKIPASVNPKKLKRDCANGVATLRFETITWHDQPAE